MTDAKQARSARRWRRAFLSLLLAVPTLGFIGPEGWPMVMLVVTTLLVIALPLFGLLTLLEMVFRGARAR